MTAERDLESLHVAFCGLEAIACALDQRGSDFFGEECRVAILARSASECCDDTYPFTRLRFVLVWALPRTLVGRLSLRESAPSAKCTFAERKATFLHDVRTRGVVSLACASCWYLFAWPITSGRPY